LKAEVVSLRLAPTATYETRHLAQWPHRVRSFYDSGANDRFVRAGEKEDRIEYYVRTGPGVQVYSKAIAGPGMAPLSEGIVRARTLVERLNARNLRRGFILTLIVLAGFVWAISALVVLMLSRRIGQPIEQLTLALRKLAAGDLSARLEPRSKDEIGAAMEAFNRTAVELAENRDKLVHVTRLASWQSLARKMAHEVKNSLTPIRLTMEEIVARRGERDDMFIEQAAQIVVEEVGTLERRVRAFTEFASEPPVRLEPVDVPLLLEERIALLRAAHPEVKYTVEAQPATAAADSDLVKGVLTNLLENAAQAAGPGGRVLSRISTSNGKVTVEVHDSGPGLSEQARSSLFEPTISFKKSGMGLGLSIARRSALLLGGDIVLVEGELGGAAFRVLLPRLEENAGTSCSGC
jgi:nitrogen fixation/metabolism regulation signal transduction histidine kinase